MMKETIPRWQWRLLEVEMKIDGFSFGSIRIDGAVYEDDVVIDHGVVRKRDKKPSRKFRADYGHTPLSVEEDIPWNCSRLVIGTGMDERLPVLPEVLYEAERRKIELLVVPTARAIEELQQGGPGTTNAVLHITC
jgi:hypothetical protein